MITSPKIFYGVRNLWWKNLPNSINFIFLLLKRDAYEKHLFKRGCMDLGYAFFC